MLKRIEARQAAMGMYVRKFEGSWFHHPFWRARFLVRTDRQLARLRDSGIGLFIDTAMGSDLAAHRPVETAPRLLSRGDFTRSAPPPAPRQVAPPPPQSSAPARVIAPRAFGKADIARATALAQRSTSVVRALFENCQLGRAVSTAPILSVVDDIASTLEQNSGAFIKVTRLRSKDDAIYTHSVAVCALMIGLAREAGCSDAVIRAMGTAGLLHDVGKVAVDDALLNKPGELAEGEIAAIRRHPHLGHDILSAETGLPPAALDVCMHHHERLDGTGYPHGLRGESISQASRMAALCDVYDAMTSGGPDRKAKSPMEAIVELEASDGKFDASLLFRFMRSIGVFPAGKLVRLRSNRLAVILPAAGGDRRPLARAFYATVDTAFISYQDVVLGDRLTDDQAVSEEAAVNWFGGDWSEMCGRIVKGRPIKPLESSAKSRQLRRA